uniref:Si:dkey-192g7.3 n=1 Tax=Sinocyclocheilus rhinocerous TaxID=307959 RepID=A0A673JT49_9TELE
MPIVSYMYVTIVYFIVVDGSAVAQTVKSAKTGFTGQDVLLSCNCSNDPKELIWVKGQRVVNVHPHDKSIIDDSYVDRTQLFLNKEKRNCSLLLLNIFSADAGLYTCHALVSVGDNVWSKRSSEVNLTGELSKFELENSLEFNVAVELLK